MSLATGGRKALDRSVAVLGEVVAGPAEVGMLVFAGFDRHGGLAGVGCECGRPP
jgi:hypothetical protein